MNTNTKYTSLTLEELSTTSDIIPTYLPLNSKINNLINKTNISMLKENAIFLNLGLGNIANVV